MTKYVSEYLDVNGNKIRVDKDGKIHRIMKADTGHLTGKTNNKMPNINYSYSRKK